MHLLYFQPSNVDALDQLKNLTIDAALFADLPRPAAVGDQNADAEYYDDYDDDEYADNDDDYDDYDYASDSYQKSSYASSLAPAASANHQQSSSNRVTAYQPSDKLFRKYTNRISVERYEGPADLPSAAVNTLLAADRRSEQERFRSKDKHDRATAEQVRTTRSISIFLQFFFITSNAIMMIMIASTHL